jgi:hypothetical protein
MRKLMVFTILIVYACRERTANKTVEKNYSSADSLATERKAMMDYRGWERDRYEERIREGQTPEAAAGFVDSLTKNFLYKNGLPAWFAKYRKFSDSMDLAEGPKQMAK